MHNLLTGLQFFISLLRLGFLMSGITVDNFQSLAKVPPLSASVIMAVMTGVKYTFNFFINLDGIGYVLQFVALLSPIIFCT